VKHFLKSTAAMALALCMTAPLALAQPVPPGPPGHPPAHPNHPDASKVIDNGNHDKIVNKDVVNHDKTVINHTTVVQHPSPWAPNGFVQGHAPGDNRLPIYTQGYGGHPAYVGGARAWHRGDRYDGPRDVVTNWDAYHANRPPSGYEYVRNGNQLVLIAIASGVVADVLANAIQ
jgi:Ni/Co efflux regulator RcnB